MLNICLHTCGTTSRNLVCVSDFSQMIWWEGNTVKMSDISISCSHWLVKPAVTQTPIANTKHRVDSYLQINIQLFHAQPFLIFTALISKSCHNPFSYEPHAMRRLSQNETGHQCSDWQILVNNLSLCMFMPQDQLCSTVGHCVTDRQHSR